MSTAPASPCSCVVAEAGRGPGAPRRLGGFTLIELILACVMMTILFSATYASLSQAIRSRDRAVARTAAYTRAGLAADLIARDVSNALRASDLLEAKVAIVREGRAGSGLDGLLLFTHIDRPVRPASGQPEGDECETQYRLEPVGIGASPDEARYALWRRRQPVPDEYPDAGGVASVMVDGLRSLTVEAYSGSEWRTDWDSDNDGLPYAIRLTVVGVDDDGRASATVRRVVALDRVPIPPVAEDIPETGGTTTTPDATGTSGTGTGATGGGAQGGGGRGGPGGGGGGGGQGGGGPGGGQNGGQGGGGRGGPGGGGPGPGGQPGQGGGRGGGPGGGGGAGGGGAGGGGAGGGGGGGR